MSKVRVLVGRLRPALRRLGDLPPERLRRRSQPPLRLANQRLVRPDPPSAPTTAARPGISPASSPRRRPAAARRSKATSLPTTLRGNRQASHHPPVVRRHATSVGVQTRLAPRALSHATPTPSTPASKMPPSSARPMAVKTGTNSPACAATAPVRSGNPERAAWASTR